MDFFEIKGINNSEEELGRISRAIHLEESHTEMEERSRWPAPYDEEVCAGYFLSTEKDKDIITAKEKIAEETLSRYWNEQCRTFSGLARLIRRFPALYMEVHTDEKKGTASVTVGRYGNAGYRDGRLVPDFCPEKNAGYAAKMLQDSGRTVFLYKGKEYPVTDVEIKY